LNNHDVVRHASRFGGLTIKATDSDGIGPSDPQPNRELGLQRARGATLFMLGLPGSAYLYQGEELGLPEHTTLAPEFRQDPTFARTEGKRVGRDGCRVPLPWEAEVGAANGFNASGKSWLPQPEIYAEYSRNLQERDPNSTLSLYKEALDLRKELGLGEGNFSWQPGLTNSQTLAYQNGEILVIHNFGSTQVALPQGEILLASSPIERLGELDPNCSVWLKVQ
jgi:alpha-glucosidase